MVENARGAEVSRDAFVFAAQSTMALRIGLGSMPEFAAGLITQKYFGWEPEDPVWLRKNGAEYGIEYISNKNRYEITKTEIIGKLEKRESVILECKLNSGLEIKYGSLDYFQNPDETKLKISEFIQDLLSPQRPQREKQIF